MIFSAGKHLLPFSHSKSFSWDAFSCECRYLVFINSKHWADFFQGLKCATKTQLYHNYPIFHVSISGLCSLEL